jgi:outer membrane protein TolC
MCPPGQPPAEPAINVEKTLWQALSDVDNALSARTRLKDEGAALARSLEATRATERLTEVRYRAGAIALQATSTL